MFGLFEQRLPVSQEQAEWTDRSFLRLASLLVSQRMIEAAVALPTDAFFPDRHDRSETALRAMFTRVANLMRGEPNEVDVGIHVHDHDLTRSLVPFHEGKASGAAGLVKWEREAAIRRDPVAFLSHWSRGV